MGHSVLKNIERSCNRLVWNILVDRVCGKITTRNSGKHVQMFDGPQGVSEFATCFNRAGRAPFEKNLAT